MLPKELLLAFSLWRNLDVETKVLGFVLWRPNNMYVFDILERLHLRKKMKLWKFIMIQEIDICETPWYKIVGLSILTHMLYKRIANEAIDFYNMKTKVYINYELQQSRWSWMFNPWLVLVFWHNVASITVVEKWWTWCMASFA